MLRQGPRIAIVGFAIESNSFAPPVGEAHFAERVLLRGAALEEDIFSGAFQCGSEIFGFASGMTAGGQWRPMPIVVADGGAAGAVESSFFARLLDEAIEGIRSLGPVDGVYCALHGAALTTDDLDPEATLLEALRAVVGADVPIVATLDLHANVSRGMVQAADVLVAYLTNPHVDMEARGLEAAMHMQTLLSGEKLASAWRRVPIVAPTVSLLTSHGPYGEVVALGQERAKADARIVNVSVCGGFPFADVPEPGPTVVVTARGDRDAAEQLADVLAVALWSRRERFEARLTSIDGAVAALSTAVRDGESPPLCLADVGDNPGGGGLGNTVHILAACVTADLQHVVFGIHHEPQIAAEAHRLGVGARFQACFGALGAWPGAAKFEAAVEVVAISGGRMTGRRGMLAGRLIDLGASARLRIAGIDVIVTSIRQQCCDPVMIEHFGIDLGRIRGLVVKSRGHFRAGFDELFDDPYILEVDAPGLTSPVLSRVPYTRLKRPVAPLDGDVAWAPGGD